MQNLTATELEEAARNLDLQKLLWERESGQAIQDAKEQIHADREKARAQTNMTQTKSGRRCGTSDEIHGCSQGRDKIAD